MRTTLTEQRAAALARAALGGRPGRAPNCWALARLFRRFPASAAADGIRAALDRRLMPGGVAVLSAGPGGSAPDSAAPDVFAAGDFERAHGWAWLLKLAAELRGLDGRWGEALAPLADASRDRFLDALPRAACPVRAGTRGNAAFALALARDYAVAAADDELLGLLWKKAVDWYGRDRGRGDEEPGGQDVLSPALVEAECMRRLLPSGQWRPWVDAFLPALGEGRPEALFRPAGGRAGGGVPRRGELNLSRAWCWRGLASGLAPGDPRRAAMEAAAERHLAASLCEAVDAFAGDTADEPWRTGLALLALEA